jgi:ERCC4-type nuclease
MNPLEPCPSCGASVADLGLLAARDALIKANLSNDGFRPLIQDGSVDELRALIAAYDTGAMRGLEFARLVEIMRRWIPAIESWTDNALYYKMAPPPAVIEDTSEQKPWRPLVLRIGATGPHYVECPIKRESLDACDYALFDLTGLPHGCKWPIGIERKSAADLYGTMLTGRERFLSMWSEACKLFERRFLIIESTLQDFEKYRWERCLRRESEKDGPNAEKLFDQQKRGIHNGLLAIVLDFGVQVIWCDGVEQAEKTCGYLLDRVARQLTDPKEKQKARERGVHRSAPWIGEP